MDLTAFEEAPAINVRARCTAAAYLVGDASGSGFGDCLWVDGDEGLDNCVWVLGWHLVIAIVELSGGIQLGSKAGRLTEVGPGKT